MSCFIDVLAHRCQPDHSNVFKTKPEWIYYSSSFLITQNTQSISNDIRIKSDRQSTIDFLFSILFILLEAVSIKLSFHISATVNCNFNGIFDMLFIITILAYLFGLYSNLFELIIIFERIRLSVRLELISATEMNRVHQLTHTIWLMGSLFVLTMMKMQYHEF